MTDHALLVASLRHQDITGGLDALPSTMQYVKDLTPFVEERTRLRAEFKAAKEKIAALEIERRSAPARRVTAIRSGEGKVATDVDIAQRTAETQERIDTIRQALERVDKDRAALLARNRATYLAEAEKHLRPLRAKAREAVEAMESAWRAVVTLETACAAIANGGDGTRIVMLPTLDIGQTPRVDLIAATMLAALADPVVSRRNGGTVEGWANSGYAELAAGVRQVGTEANSQQRVAELARGERRIGGRG